MEIPCEIGSKAAPLPPPVPQFPSRGGVAGASLTGWSNYLVTPAPLLPPVPLLEGVRGGSKG